MADMPGCGPIILKPNKPDPFDGQRDFLVVNTWIYKMEQYLGIVQVSNPHAELTDATRIMYASTFFSGTAAVWWFTICQWKRAPSTWSDFKKTVTAEFVPVDHVRRSMDKLRRLKHTGSVSQFLAKFRKVILTSQELSEGEKLDRFCSALKYDIRLEVLKSAVVAFEDAENVALRIDSALWTVGKSGE